MREKSNRILWAPALAVGLALSAAAWGQERKLDCQDRHGRSNDRRVGHCEMREQTVAAPAGPIAVDGGQNGGLSVKGSDRQDVLVRARVEAWAETETEARSVALQIRILTDSGRITPQGPPNSRDRSWSVSFEVLVPRRSDLDLKTVNGGVSVAETHGNIGFSAVNGGVSLQRIGGRVRGRTVNGGLSIELDGQRWEGDGLDARTTNGGVDLSVPEGYSARLETSTVNGRLRADLPMTVQGEVGKTVSATLGSGGALLKVGTTNGGVKVRRAGAARI